MSVRNKLLLVLVATVVVTTVAVSIAVAAVARRAFQRQEQARSQAIATQFRREFDRSGEDVVRRVSAVAASDVVRRIALDVTGAHGGAYLSEATQLAVSHGLDFLEIVSADGAILSSAEFPARFGYRDEWAELLPRLSTAGASLRRQELPNGSALGIFAVCAAAGDQSLYVVGGVKLDPEFMSRLAVPEDTVAALFTTPDRLFTVDDATTNALVISATKSGRDTSGIANQGNPPQTVHAFPLKGVANDVLALFVVTTSRAELIRTEQYIRSVALAVAGIGIIFAIVISGWFATRVTLPIEQLAAGAACVAAGDWSARVNVHSTDEIGQLADDFNHMTAELINHRDRLVQAERVAAWRELARRLAHELKNPLFPLQITVENLVRARQLSPAEFDEVFRESTATLLTELGNLRSIIGRFSDFSRMPRPQLESVSLNGLVQQVAKSHEAQLTAHQPPIVLKMQLDVTTPHVEADPALLHRALSNLFLNAIDAMPQGGTLTLRTRGNASDACIEIEDTGAGMTPEECERLFTPYYTTKQHGTGLGLAIVQSVISDHGGKITVESSAGAGSTFRIQLPLPAQAFHTGTDEVAQRSTEKSIGEPL
jgi:two-component system nitrogen regulation sensor histidine kinase NtrY